MKRLVLFLGLVTAALLPTAPTLASIVGFDRIEIAYEKVTGKLEQAIGRVTEHICPNLSGIELDRCYADWDGDLIPYRVFTNQEYALFIYRVRQEDIFGLERRHVEEKGFSIRVNQNTAMMFLLSREAIKTGDDITKSDPVLRVYHHEIDDEGRVSQHRTELTVPGQGWKQSADWRGKPRPPRHKPDIFYDETIRGITLLHNLANKAFWN